MPEAFGFCNENVILDTEKCRDSKDPSQPSLDSMLSKLIIDVV